MKSVKSMKAFIGRLAGLGAVRVPGCGPDDPPKRWFEVIDDMAHCRSQ